MNKPSDFETRFRRHYAEHYKDNEYTYEQYREAYEYGFHLGENEEGGETSWESVAPRAEDQWSAQNRGTWAQFEDAAKYGWEVAREMQAAG